MRTFAMKSATTRTPWATVRPVLVLGLLPLLWANASCLSGEPERECGEGQGYVDGQCVCPAGYRMDGDECIACGPNMVVSDQNKCVCAPGFDREDNDEPCVALAPEPCEGDDCEVGGDSCTESSQCPSGQYCDMTASPTACKAIPTGEGTPCSSDADCAGLDASYCELAVSQTCLVQGCDPAFLNSCSDDYICCDFTTYGWGTLCVSKAASGGTCSGG